MDKISMGIKINSNFEHDLERHFDREELHIFELLYIILCRLVLCIGVMAFETDLLDVLLVSKEGCRD